MESKENMKIRAIYAGDVRFDTCPVFELNVETHKFVMVSDPEFQYEDLDVYADEDFLIFKVVTENVDTLKSGNETEYEKVEYVNKI